MTQKQYRLCKTILRHKALSKILESTQIEDYLRLDLEFEPDCLEFSNDKMDDSTIVSLSNSTMEEFEARRARVADVWVTRIIAVAALIISAIALLAQLGILGMQPSL